MDGLLFLQILREEPAIAAIPVIMLSGAEDRDNVLQAAKLGIRGYILKSHFSLKDLLARVTQHFDSLKSAEPPVQVQQNVPEKSTCPSPGRSDSRVNGSSPSDPKNVATETNGTNSKSGAPATPNQIPTLLTRKQCIDRAKQALHGQTLSGVVTHVISLAASPRGDSSDLTSMIARDSLLAARVLQVANSAAHTSVRGIVTTLPDAVRNIGCAAVRNIAAAMGVFNAIPSSNSDGFNLLRCWQHAFTVGTLCNQLAAESDSGVAYLVGLCHDLGEILFHSQFSEEYAQVLEMERATGKPRDEVERIMLGMSHGEILETIVKCLELPAAISTPIQEFHSKGPNSSGGSRLTRLLRVADLYANGMLLASSNLSPIRPITCADAKAATGHDNPPQFDRAIMRNEIIGLTATLSGFSPEHVAEVTTSPFPRLPLRVWMARDASLSSLDPVEASLELLAEGMTTRDALPMASEAAEYDAIVVSARSTLATGFTAADLEKLAPGRNGRPLPILWLVGRIDGEMKGRVPSRWPIPLNNLANFVAAAGRP